MSNVLREIGSNTAKLRALLTHVRKERQQLQTLQNALQEALTDLWTSPEITQLSKSHELWKEFINLVASGRIISVTAQAANALNAGSSELSSYPWVSDGKKYAAWLGRGIAELAKHCNTNASAQTAWRPVMELCGRSFSLGYTDEIVTAIIETLLFEQRQDTATLQCLVQNLAHYHQRSMLLSTMNLISSRYLKPSASTATTDHISEARLVSGAGALLQAISSGNEETMAEHLSEWLIKVPNTSLQLYRAVTAVIPPEELEKTLGRIWLKFGDNIFIKHSPIIQQEGMARLLLLIAGKIHRKIPMAVFVLAHSSIHTNGTSNRLASSSSRARFLGMAVGSAISQLVDKPETRMTFEFDQQDREEYAQFQSLLDINDSAGSLDELPTHKTHDNDFDKVVAQRPKPSVAAKRRPQKTISKVQVMDESSGEDDDLPVYAKPDSDPEDSDEDPTVARRQRPRAPVYIRDLISGLSNTDDHDAQHLALTTAPPLIRRKAEFGTELSDCAIELGATYFNLSDPFGLDDFLELRLKGMTALLVAQPKLCAPYFAATVFIGDFNIGQRVAGLSAMGLSARELAGYHDDDTTAEPQFPSRTLPERLHNLYLDSAPMDQLMRRMEAELVRAVSTSKRSRSKHIRNDLSQLVAVSFFYPLTGHFAAHVSSLPSLSRLLPTFLRTLAIILTSAGPSNLALPQLTAEFFQLLLSLRGRALTDPAVLEALLFAFLALFNMNENKHALAEEHARAIVECHEWCNLVFERLSEGVSLNVADETQRTRTLCAGVLGATSEVREAYDRVLFARVGGLEL